MKFSVLMSTYKSDSPEQLREAMESVLSQSVPPDEIVLVRDGPVPEALQRVIDGYVSHKALFTYIPLTENGGLGKALGIGLEKARNPLVARMDADDICAPDRFLRQIAYFEKNPQTDICGGQIEEFITSPREIAGKREVPLTGEEICRFLKKRCPFNHVTVMFKKSAVMQAGNYQSFHLMEDYYLWCRMYLQNAVFANLPETLVYVRIGEDMYRRRGGFRYFRSGYQIEKFKLQNHIVGVYTFLQRTAMRFGAQVLMPGWLRGWALKRFFRKKV